ncbi:MAG: hypothetical protein KAJ65_00990 [Gammaproteobacteria bacterium]|nr:hypothetical protein [Gammaproteobacteria bacterium]
MSDRQPAPGISRTQRLSDEGLQRLDRQLASGSQISDAVLVQWIRRYGESARALIRQHGRYHAGLEPGDALPGAR